MFYAMVSRYLEDYDVLGFTCNDGNFQHNSIPLTMHCIVVYGTLYIDT